METPADDEIKNEGADEVLDLEGLDDIDAVEEPVGDVAGTNDAISGEQQTEAAVEAGDEELDLISMDPEPNVTDDQPEAITEQNIVNNDGEELLDLGDTPDNEIEQAPATINDTAISPEDEEVDLVGDSEPEQVGQSTGAETSEAAPAEVDTAMPDTGAPAQDGTHTEASTDLNMETVDAPMPVTEPAEGETAKPDTEAQIDLNMETTNTGELEGLDLLNEQPKQTDKALEDLDDLDLEEDMEVDVTGTLPEDKTTETQRENKNEYEALEETAPRDVVMEDIAPVEVGMDDLSASSDGSEISFDDEEDLRDVYGIDDDDYVEEPTKKRRLKRKAGDSGDSAPPKKKKKKAPKRSDAELDPEDRQEREIRKEFGELIKKRRRKVVTPVSTDEITSRVSKIVEEMHVAKMQDDDCFQAGEPAIHKLALLPKVEHILQQIAWQDTIDTEILTSLSYWLVPYPNGSLPNIKIRTVILKSLRMFNEKLITKDNLKLSSLGKTVNYLATNPKESKANKELAGKLIRKWSKIIFNISNVYSQADIDQATTTAPQLRRGSKMIKISARHAAIPERASFDYQKPPPNRISESAREYRGGPKSRQGTTKLAAVIKKPKRNAKKRDSTRAVHMSINK